MKATRLIKAGKIVTVSSAGTIVNGCIAVADGKIVAVGPWEALVAAHPEAEILDYSDRTVTPGLVDPHVHTLEYGGSTALGAGELTQLAAGAALLVGALRAGVTTVGEQLLGHYLYRRPIEAYKEAVRGLPRPF